MILETLHRESRGGAGWRSRGLSIRQSTQPVAQVPTGIDMIARSGRGLTRIYLKTQLRGGQSLEIAHDLPLSAYAY
jgi:hypothetical protein